MARQQGRPMSDGAFADHLAIAPEGVRFAVWTTVAEAAEVVVQTKDGQATFPLERGAGGMFAGTVPGIGAGARYWFRLDGGPLLPDPRSRFQPEGVHGPSQVVDLAAFPWSDGGWPGLTTDGLVIYELHIGTFTSEGTFAAVIGELPRLRDLGVNAIELMPVADFPGRWNWGYDGVALSAPSRAYGRPEDLQRLVDAAHAHGIGVLLDVVYNHLGPDGNVLPLFSPEYFTDRETTPWGDAIDYTVPEVRAFAIDNACLWMREYHLDGLRLDATHAIFDDGAPSLLAELAERARAAAGRPIVLIAEDGRRDPRITRSTAEGGFGLDAQWADDFHHSIRVRLAGDRHAWFSRYDGAPREIAGIVEGCFPLARREGVPAVDALDPAAAFVFFLQNHDQVGNRALGDRLHQGAGRNLAAVGAAIMLFSPQTPMLWMGEEFGAESPFCYFTDHAPDLGRLIREGRRREFAAFPEFAAGDVIPDPQAEETFRVSKLPPPGPGRDAGLETLYRDLIRLRREDPVLRVQDRARTRAAGIGETVLAIHRWTEDGHRLLLANTGEAWEIDWQAVADAAGAPVDGWRVVLSTVDVVRCGTDNASLVVPAGSASMLAIR
ncbi:MAG: malto-oligosyltrehalose trehalohydrolase [Thermomicrobiales bacterium]